MLAYRLTIAIVIIVVCLLFLQDGGDEDALHGRRGRPLRPVDRGHHQHRLRHLWTHRQRHLHLVRINTLTVIMNELGIAKTVIIPFSHSNRWYYNNISLIEQQYPLHT